MKVVEHPIGLARLARRKADVAHIQWLAAPEIDERLLRFRAPAVFTAHDLLPRRTAKREVLWRRLMSRFERIVVHSERGRDTLAELGVEPDRLRVIPMPVFPSDPTRNDDGHTLLCVGIIRPYKGIADAIEATKRVWTELGSSSPATRWSRWTRTASRPATAPSGASGTCPRARSTARSATRPWLSFHTGPRSIRARRCSVPSAPGARRRLRRRRDR